MVVAIVEIQQCCSSLIQQRAIHFFFIEIKVRAISLFNFCIFMIRFVFEMPCYLLWYHFSYWDWKLSSLSTFLCRDNLNRVIFCTLICCTAWSLNKNPIKSIFWRYIHELCVAFILLFVTHKYIAEYVYFEFIAEYVYFVYSHHFLERFRYFR
jgi:hypothetical protein